MATSGMQLTAQPSTADQPPEFVTSPEDRCYCDKCTKILREPMQSDCGHKFCKSCLEECLETACPADHPSCVILTNKNTHQDRAIEKELQELEVYCSHKLNGCGETKAWKDLEAHVQTCGYRTVECPMKIYGCKERLIQKDVENHLEQKHQLQVSPETDISGAYGGDQTDIKSSMIHRSRYTEEELEWLEVTCFNKKNGCKEFLQWKDLEAHVEICGYRIVDCPLKSMGCTEQLHQKDVERHAEHRCPYRTVLCPLCDLKLMDSKVEQHLSEVCPEKEIICQNKCGQSSIKRNMMEKHILDICPAKTRDCHFLSVGCTFQGNITEQKQHEHAGNEQHLKLLTKYCDGIKLHLSQLDNEKLKLNDLVERLTTQVEHLQLEKDGINNDYNEQKDILEAIKTKVEAINTEKQEQSDTIKTMKDKNQQQETLVQTVATQNDDLKKEVKKQETLTQAVTKQNDNIKKEVKKQETLIQAVTKQNKDIKKEVKEQKDTLETVRTQVQALNDEKQEQKATIKTMQDKNQKQETLTQAVTKQNEDIKKEVKKQERLIQDVTKQNKDLKKEVKALKKQLDTSHNGTFIWRISEYERKKQEAENGVNKALFSESFHTSQYGYQLCVQTHLNGGGDGKGTHLTLGLCIEKGAYDSIMTWPFNQDFTLTVLDQSGDPDHRSLTIEPSDYPGNLAFKQPRNDRNEGRGWPQFISHVELENNKYIKDDTLFIKVVIDTTGL